MTIAADALGDPFAPRDQTTWRLTAQDQRVLALAASGWRTAAVAEALGLTTEAVRQSLVSTMRRVGARSKIEAALIAVRDGLVDLPTDDDRACGHRASTTRPVTRLRQWLIDGRQTGDAPAPPGMDQDRQEMERLHRSTTDLLAGTD